MSEEPLPLDLEALSPEEAARALKRHNPRLRGSVEGLASAIRQVRDGIDYDELVDIEVVLREMESRPEWRTAVARRKRR